MIFLKISEEYGYRRWYAILSDDRYEELKKEWQTIKGLNCLVPVRFLIPEALGYPLLPEHAQFSDDEFLQSSGVKVISSHIHQSDDSFLDGVNDSIPDGPFEFKGVRYSKEQVDEIFQRYRDEDNKKINSSMTEIYDWPEDVELPVGWLRSNGKIVRDSSGSS